MPDPASHIPSASSAIDAVTRHGGQIAAARLAFPDAPEPWIDLSTGIAPHAYPFVALQSEIWRRLPDSGQLASLKAAARTCYRVPAAANVVAAPGTQALISLLPRVRPARVVAVLGFGYQEHPASWLAAGADVTVVSDLDALAAADVGVVINPNNPDGRFVASEQLAEIATHLARRGGLLVVDEAFAEARTAQDSFVPHLAGESALVLRSFGKFFGLAGVRLGFAIGGPRLCAALEAALGPWAISGPALTIGIQSLGDLGWQADARDRYATAAARLDDLLTRAGFDVLGGTTLFRLGAHSEAPAIFARLGGAGILVRPFRQEPGWLRFGLPADEAAWARLAQALCPSSARANAESGWIGPRDAQAGAPYLWRQETGAVMTTTTPSGLQIEELKEGTGAEARAGTSVRVHYTGWLTDGKKFDSSKDRGQPFAFKLGAGQVIRGWDEGVEGMKVGGIRKLTIPPDLGYGARGAGGLIPPGATLVFEVELLGV